MFEACFGSCKSGKIKDYKEGQESTIEDWLKRFDQEIWQLQKMCGIVGDLGREEYIDCIKDKLEFRVIKRLESVFPTKDPVVVWNTVTKVVINPGSVNGRGMTKVVMHYSLWFSHGPESHKIASVPVHCSCSPINTVFKRYSTLLIHYILVHE